MRAMQERSSHVWRMTVGLGAMVAGGVILGGAFPGYAGATDAQTEATTSSSLVEGNPTCGGLAPEGTSWTELEVESVEDGDAHSATAP